MQLNPMVRHAAKYLYVKVSTAFSSLNQPVPYLIGRFSQTVVLI